MAAVASSLALYRGQRAPAGPLPSSFRQRPLKQRARGEVLLVPCPPPLTALLHAYIQEFGVQPDGRLFVGERNDGELPTMTIGRVWRRARQAAFTAEVAVSPLAKTPYDLRHAAVSPWLNGRVPPTTVAERAWLAMQAPSDTACWSASTPLGRGRGAMLVDVDLAEFEAVPQFP